MSDLINFGSCDGPNCRTMAERCEWGKCGVCCRRLHLHAPKHTQAPPLTAAVQSNAGPPTGWKVNETAARALPAPVNAVPPKLAPLQPPKPGAMVEITEPEILVPANQSAYKRGVFET